MQYHNGNAGNGSLVWRIEMSDTKFTPGPWGDNVIVCHDPKLNFNIAFLSTDNLERRAEGQANAHLIAAAPELYEACVDAAMTFEHYAEMHRAKGTPEGDAKAKRNADMAVKLRAALAKARGEN